MARKLNDKHIDSKEARKRLKPSPKPYWTQVERGLVHLGYRRLANDNAGRSPSGTWIVRHYLGDQNYQLEKIGVADDWSDPDGNKVLSFDQAVTKARERMATRANSATNDKNKPWTVGDAIKDYLKYLEAKKSSQDARYKIEAFILPKFGEREIATLQTDELRDWLADLAKTPARKRTAKAGKKAKPQQYRAMPKGDENAKRRRRSTANRVLTSFKAALNRAWKDGKVKSDSAWRRVEPFKAVDAARQEFLTVEEAKRLINATAPDFRKLVQVALLTGCRYGELCRLKVEDIHSRSGTLAIHTSKSGQPRHVILTEEGQAYLAALAKGRAKSETLLLKANGTPWQTSQQIRVMKETSKAARINPPIGFHILRHTWASLAVMGGVPLLVVAKNMGHKDTRMVEKHYGHLVQSYEREQIISGAPRFGIKAGKSNVVGIADAKR